MPTYKTHFSMMCFWPVWDGRCSLRCIMIAVAQKWVHKEEYLSNKNFAKSMHPSLGQVLTPCSKLIQNTLEYLHFLFTNIFVLYLISIGIVTEYASNHIYIYWNYYFVQIRSKIFLRLSLLLSSVYGNYINFCEL